jgi:hypothetical protein
MTEDPSLERRLRGEPLLPVPPGLSARILLGLPRRGARTSALAALGRFAAAVAIFGAAWIATSEVAPSVALAAPVAVRAEAILEKAPEVQGGATGPLVAGGLGALLLAAGPLVARRGRRP